MALLPSIIHRRDGDDRLFSSAPASTSDEPEPAGDEWGSIEPEVGLPNVGRLAAITIVGLAALAGGELASHQYAPGAAVATVAIVLFLVRPRLDGLLAVGVRDTGSKPTRSIIAFQPNVSPEPSGWSPETAWASLPPRDLVIRPGLSGTAFLGGALILGLVVGTLIGRWTAKWRLL